jgi:hypothetical protein
LLGDDPKEKAIRRQDWLLGASDFGARTSERQSHPQGRLGRPPTGRKQEHFIWAMYRQQFQIPAEQTRPDDTDWTGAEIRSCCRLAALLDLSLGQAARQVVSVAVTAAESVEKLRNWASGRCLDASRPGIYRRNGEEPPRPGRKIRRDPSSN